MASTQLSPGIVIQERDFTTVTSVPQANIGVLAGPFERGPVGEVVTISTEKQLLAIFGKPNDNNYEYWFTASNFLGYGGTLKVIRTDASNLKNAAAYIGGADPEIIRNFQEYETSYEASSNDWNFAARTPGTFGNSIRVYVTDAGADQILFVDGPGTGIDEWEFVGGDAITTPSGAAGKVFNYTIRVQLESGFSGNFTGADTVTFGTGGSAFDLEFVAWDPSDRLLEVKVPSGGVTGRITTGLEVSQGTASGQVEVVSRRLLVVLDKGSIKFAAGDDIADTNDVAVNTGSVKDEYTERVYGKNQKWINVAARPTTSLYASQKGGFRDEMHILVVDADGKITGTPETVLEKHLFVSKASDAKSTQGDNNYYKAVIKSNSQYIYWGAHETQLFSVDLLDGAWGVAAANTSYDLIKVEDGFNVEVTNNVVVGSVGNSTSKYTFTGGSNDWAPTITSFSSGYSLVADSEVHVIDYLLMGPSGGDITGTISKASALIDIANTRKDCMAFISAHRSDVIGQSDTEVITNRVVDYFDQVPSTSYAVFDAGYKYIYDKYNDTYRYVPCNSDIAGLCLQTATNQEPWYSPAGFSRGVLRNAIKLAYSPTKDQRDRLYAARVNPIVAFPGQGIVLFGDKTALSYQSAFDRINVRRLFLTMERVIGISAKSLLFEQNDETSRSSFRNLVEPYLRDIQGRRGITDYLVKCDTENNPPDSVDRGEFYAEIYVKPTRSINFITLTFVATRTGISFNEVAS